MRILGIDPGVSGGLAVVEIADGAAPALVECIDIPVAGTGAKERVDAAGIRNFIDRHQPIRALIERAQAMPKQGVSSGFKYGRAIGAIEATVALCSIPVEIIEPSAWKRHWHLPGKDKESGRQKALQQFPAAHAALARKKDHGRAEAMLIALTTSSASRGSRHERATRTSSFAVWRQCRGARSALPSVRRPRRESARKFTPVVRLCGPWHSIARSDNSSPR